MDNVRTMLRTYRSERFAVLVIAVLLVLGAFLETVALLLLVPIATAVATGSDTINRTIGGVTLTASPSALVFTSMACVVVGLAVRVLTAQLQARATIRVEQHQRDRLYDGYLHASWAAQAAEPPGRFQWASGLTSAYADLLNIILNSLRYVINLAMMLIAAFLVSPTGAVVITAVAVALYVMLRPLLRASRLAQERALDARQRQDERIAEMVPMAGQIRAFGVTGAFINRLADDARAVLKEKRTAMLLAATVSPVYQAIGLLIALGILAYATTRQLDIPALGAVALLLLRSIASAQGVQSTLHKYAEYRPVLDALEAWNRRYDELREEPGTVDIASVESVELVDVSYSYDSESPALHGLSLGLLPGDDVGLVGPSGAGKSTLAQVLLRFRAPSRGVYLVNGIDAASISPASFSREVAYVPQAPLLLRGTVHDNITLYRKGLDRARVQHAAQQAGLHTWIASLPQGYDTVIGPDTHGFSGGQAQRLSIARALAGSPSMLVLDEPTSALDVDAEEIVTAALKGLPEHVIVVLIAHRMSTLRHCNRVVVLEDGRMTASGTTAETMEDNAFFRRAVEAGAFAASPLGQADLRGTEPSPV